MRHFLAAKASVECLCRSHRREGVEEHALRANRSRLCDKGRWQDAAHASMLASRHHVQPTSDATAMWANDFRPSSQASHFCSLPPRPKLANSTFGLCQ